MRGDEDEVDPGFRRRAWIVVGVCALVVILLWLGAIVLEPGRNLENAIWRGSLATPRFRQGVTADVLRWVSLTSLAVIIAGILAIGAFRHRVITSLVAVVSIGATLGTVDVVKALIERPLGEHTNVVLQANTFPSGHAAFATATALAALMVIPRSWRRRTMVIAGLFVAFQSTGVMATGWHRPSDVLGAEAIALAWSTIGLLVLSRLRHSGLDDRDPAQSTSNAKAPSQRPTARSAVTTIEVVIASIALTDLLPHREMPVSDRLSFVLAESLVGAASVIVVWIFASLLTEGSSTDSSEGPVAEA